MAFEKGIGVIADIVMAKMWYDRAKSSGYRRVYYDFDVVVCPVYSRPLLFVEIGTVDYWYCGRYYDGGCVYYGYEAPGGYIGGGDWVHYTDNYNTTVINEVNNNTYIDMSDNSMYIDDSTYIDNSDYSVNVDNSDNSMVIDDSANITNLDNSETYYDTDNSEMNYSTPEPEPDYSGGDDYGVGDYGGGDEPIIFPEE